MITTTQNKSILLMDGQRLSWRYEFAAPQAFYNQFNGYYNCPAGGDVTLPGPTINLNEALSATDAEIIGAIESEIKTDARLRSMIEQAEAARGDRIAQLAALKAAPEDTPEWRQEVVDLEISLRRNGEHISGT